MCYAKKYLVLLYFIFYQSPREALGKFGRRSLLLSFFKMLKRSRVKNEDNLLQPGELFRLSKLMELDTSKRNKRARNTKLDTVL